MDELEKNAYDFMNRKVEKPPLGLMPRNVWASIRLLDVIAAIDRYIEAKHEIPAQWIEEYNLLIKEVK